MTHLGQTISSWREGGPLPHAPALRGWCHLGDAGTGQVSWPRRL